MTDPNTSALGGHSEAVKRVPIPALMQNLTLDRRGYPIPFVVAYDAKGIPMFTANENVKTWRCIDANLCAICGQGLSAQLWFVGGPQSAFHPNGCYFDTAMHHECMTYALKVCPYLATPNASRITDATIAKLQDRMPGQRLADVTQDLARPALFVAVMATSQTHSPDPTLTSHRVRPKRPYQDVEFWRNGVRLEFDVGLAEVAKIPELDIDGPLRLLLKRKVG